MTPPEGRATVRTIGDLTVLDDTYNANPGSVRAALATLAELARERGGRAVAVLGEMKELGSASREEHAAIGEVLVQAGVSLAIGCGGLASLMLERVSGRGIEVVDASDVAAAGAALLSLTRPGDVILVKGSRSVGTEAIVTALAQRGRGEG
jgi:UDP-N-acetylmuramoyl-tripeptide--D-alanyl-D-alanine ligase